MYVIRFQDFATWKKAYDDFDAERQGLGVAGDAVYQTVDNPNEVTVYHDFNSIEDAKAFASSDKLKEVMKGAGVAGEPTIWFVQEAS